MSVEAVSDCCWANPLTGADVKSAAKANDVKTWFRFIEYTMFLNVISVHTLQ